MPDQRTSDEITSQACLNATKHLNITIDAMRYALRLTKGQAQLDLLTEFACSVQSLVALAALRDAEYEIELIKEAEEPTVKAARDAKQYKEWKKSMGIPIEE
jgi:hypothetical protein